MVAAPNFRHEKAPKISAKALSSSDVRTLRKDHTTTDFPDLNITFPEIDFDGIGEMETDDPFVEEKRDLDRRFFYVN